MYLMIVQVFMQAAVLCGILYVVAKYEADYSFQKVAMVAAGITLGNMLITALLREHIKDDLRWILVFPCIAFTAVMIMSFCWISLWKSVLVVVIFVLFQTGTDVVKLMVMKRLSNSINAPADAAIQKKANDIEELRKEMLATMGPHNTQKPRAPNKPANYSPTQPVTNVINKQAEPKTKVIKKKKIEVNPRPDSANWDQAKKRLRVAGISQQRNKFVALVNNKVVVKDSIIRVTHKDMIYQWQITAITKTDVTWKQLSARPVKKPSSVLRR
ncbi:MAG: hypothetical protein KAH23_02565 [Kiritimatiellae bacterium]|nr:hypothetical protein [Kiritimatiellia bacterium]